MGELQIIIAGPIRTISPSSWDTKIRWVILSKQRDHARDRNRKIIEEAFNAVLLSGVEHRTLEKSRPTKSDTIFRKDRTESKWGNILVHGFKDGQHEFPNILSVLRLHTE